MTAPFSGWGAVMQHLAAAYPSNETLGDEAIRFLYPMEGQELEAFAKRTDRGVAPPWIGLGVRLAVEAGVELAPLLRVREPVGTVCLFGTHLCVMHNLPLRGLTAAALARTLAHVGAATLRYRHRITTRTPEGSPFSFYVD